MRALSAIPSPLLFGIAALIVVQLSLQVAAIVSLVRTPAERITIGGRKWVWALIILLGELLGPILYFLAGRTPAPAVEPTTASPVAERAASAVDSLYGAGPATGAGSAEESVERDGSAVPEERVAETDPGDPEVGADGTGAGELP